MFTQTNPLIKVPIEQMINQNVFFEQPIVEEGDSKFKRIDHMLMQLAPYSVGKDFLKKDGADLRLHALNQVTEIKMLSYDYEAFKRMKIKQMIEKMQNR